MTRKFSMQEVNFFFNRPKIQSLAENVDIFAFDLYGSKIAKNIALQHDSFHGSHVFGLIMSSLSLEKSRLIKFVLKN